MKERGLALIAVAAVAIIAAFLFFPRKTAREETLPAPPPAPTQPAPAPPQESAVKFPLPESPAPVPETPLPALGESDHAVREDLATVIGADAVSKFVAIDDVIRRIVSTVDNLPREKLALRLWPILPTAGKFTVVEHDGRTELSPENHLRYEPVMVVVAAVDARRAAAFYQHFYPLFQQAYRDLGYPSGYFNDRLVEVIDHLLAAPEVTGPIELVRPAVYYKYADPALEQLSAGQKVLIRIGPENGKLLKAKLAEFRRQIAG